MPPVYDPDPGDQYRITVDMDSRLRNWIEYFPQDKVLALSPDGNVPATFYEITVSVTDEKDQTDYRVSILVKEAGNDQDSRDRGDEQDRDDERGDESDDERDD